MKVVITGGPSSGKSTLIEEFSRRGFVIVPEAATIVIKRGVHHPTRDPIAFQREVLALQMKLERDAEGKASGIIFCDRGIYDGLAYLRFYGISESVIRLPEVWRYDEVFYLEQLPYVRDEIRFETPEEARRISELLWEVYRELGYAPIRVPAMPVRERADLVIKLLQEAKTHPKQVKMVKSRESRDER
jgi:predicted ATPase